MKEKTIIFISCDAKVVNLYCVKCKHKFTVQAKNRIKCLYCGNKGE